MALYSDKNAVATTALVNFITAIIEGLLALRVLLKLFGASTIAPFTRWVYDTTQPLLEPFEGMFPTTRLEGALVIEFSALFALIAYSFLGYVILQALSAMTPTIKQKG